MPSGAVASAREIERKYPPSQRPEASAQARLVASGNAAPAESGATAAADAVATTRTPAVATCGSRAPLTRAFQSACRKAEVSTSATALPVKAAPGANGRTGALWLTGARVWPQCQRADAPKG